MTLVTPPVSTALARMFAEAGRVDPVVLAQARECRPTLDAPGLEPSLAPILSEAYLAVAPEVGRLLYLLTRLRRPRLIVEFGTSFGVSTIHLAAALRDNRSGRLVSTEMEAAKVRKARENLEAAGLEDLVEIREGNAFDTLARDLDDPIDLLLLDGWKDFYLPLLKWLEPRLAADALVVADDMRIRPETLASYLAYVRDPMHGYASVEVPLDDGLEVSLRSAGY
jgi:predicted O-methyltransferase YrrM